MNNILIIAPHADDEILGCGGVIAKYISNGHKVFVLIATNASVGAPDIFSAADVESIRREALASHKSLGVYETIFLDYPAPNLRNSESFRISLKFTEIISRIKPKAVFLPHPSDLHSDHGVIYESALVSLRPFSDCPVPFVYKYIWIYFK